MCSNLSPARPGCSDLRTGLKARFRRAPANLPPRFSVCYYRRANDESSSSHSGTVDFCRRRYGGLPVSDPAKADSQVCTDGNRPHGGRVSRRDTHCSPDAGGTDRPGRPAGRGLGIRGSSNDHSSVLHARVDPGDFVEEGQTLIELENIALDESVRRAETTLEQAKSDLEAQQARRANIEQTPASGGRFSAAGRIGAFCPQRRAAGSGPSGRGRKCPGQGPSGTGRRPNRFPISGYVAERRVSIGDRVSPGTEVVHGVDTSILKLTAAVVDVNSSETLSTRGKRSSPATRSPVGSSSAR